MRRVPHEDEHKQVMVVNRLLVTHREEGPIISREVRVESCAQLHRQVSIRKDQ